MGQNDRARFWRLEVRGIHPYPSIECLDYIEMCYSYVLCYREQSSRSGADRLQSVLALRFSPVQ